MTAFGLGRPLTGLGRPIRVCSKHVGVLSCPQRCLGVDLDSIGELESATHTGCALCKLRPRAVGARPFRTLRKCHYPRCYARFHQDSFDDLHLGEWLRFLMNPRAWLRRRRRRFR